MLSRQAPLMCSLTSILRFVHTKNYQWLKKCSWLPPGLDGRSLQPTTFFNHDFSRWRTRWRQSAILDSFYVYLDHPWRVFVRLCHCAKIGWNRCSSFDNMRVLTFCEFGLKMPIHASFRGGGFWGIWPPRWDVISTNLPNVESIDHRVVVVFKLCWYL